VGDNGVIQHSQNGGSSWSDRRQGDQRQLWQVMFGDANNGIAVGDEGAVQTSDDAGLSWQSGDSQVSENLFDVWMHDESFAIAVGANATALRSGDGGATWLPMVISAVALTQYEGVSMWDLDNGLIVGSVGTGTEVILRTVDGGDNWTPLDSLAVPERRLLDVWAVKGTTTAYVVGTNGRILRTDDLGDSFSVQGAGVSTSELWGVQFIDADTGWISAFATHILRTTNGGTSWERIALASNLLTDIHFFNAQTGYASANIGGMHLSSDGGLSWGPSQLGGETHVRSVWATSPTHAITVGAEGIIKYTDTAGEAP
jgi:photosystem II stability/assembly factor-like uncharacterized protein